MRTRTIVIAAPILILAMLLSGCGGGSTDQPASAQPPPSQPPPQSPPQSPPVVTINADPIAFIGDGVTLTATVSGQTGEINYEWIQIGDPLVSFSGATTQSITFIAPEVDPGVSLRFEVRASGTSGTATTVASVEILIYPRGTGGAPIADAGADKYSYIGNPVGYGNQVTLNGHGSSDPEGDQLFFNWNVVSRPSGSTAVLSDSYSPITEFRPDQPGIYEIDLIVTDGQSSSEPDRVLVTACRWLEGDFPSGVTITAENGPYYLAFIRAPFGATVIIEAGTDFACNIPSASTGGLAVGGKLEIRGTAERPVNMSFMEIRVPEQESDSWYFDWEISHARFSPPYWRIGLNRGTMRITDSVTQGFFLNQLTVPAGGNAQHVFERNVVVGWDIRVTHGISDHLVFKNNLLIDTRLAFAGESTLEFAENTILFPGRTRMCEQYSGNWTCEIYNMSDKDVDIGGNYWGDLELETIESLISDGKDAPSPFGQPQAGIIYVEPLLSEPAAQTPDAQPYLN